MRIRIRNFNNLGGEMGGGRVGSTLSETKVRGYGVKNFVGATCKTGNIWNVNK